MGTGKRCMDIFGAVLGLCITFVLGLILVPLIRLDGGKAIFSQKRIGRNGRAFTMYKFRSMKVGAEDEWKALQDKNEMRGAIFKIDKDPRLTKLGYYIRKTSLDEFPQFWNVLKGDMSLVGPRPPLEEEYALYTREEKKRLSVKPGITGIWQISGRSNIRDFSDIVKMDLDYIDRQSILLDLKILCKTVWIVMKGVGAR